MEISVDRVGDDRGFDGHDVGDFGDDGVIDGNLGVNGFGDSLEFLAKYLLNTGYSADYADLFEWLCTLFLLRNQGQIWCMNCFGGIISALLSFWNVVLFST